MEKRYTLSVHDMTRAKLCELYDSSIQTEGEPYEVMYQDSMDGSKTVTFTLPKKLNDGEDNYRAAYMTNDFLLRLGIDGVFDWFVIDEPEDSHTAQNVIKVTAHHISTLLNRKNLYGFFDDTNGIDTCYNLISKALTDTGWSIGVCDTFYESDGVTEKVRSYTCSEKTGAYAMITGICDLFVAWPSFNGDAKTVDIHAKANHDGSPMMEVNFGKNLDTIARKRTSGELITRLYVEGDYDQDTYVGIEDATANTSGLPFILNFDYYRETGQFTATHEAALTAYITAMSTAQAAIKTAAAEQLAAETSLAEKWGAGDFVLYSVSGGTPTYVMKSAGATDADKTLVQGDKIAAVKSNGEYVYLPTTSTPTFGNNIAWAVKFLGQVAGSMGAAEVSVEAKQKTVTTLTNEKNAAGTTEVQKTALTAEINTQNTAIASLNTSRYADMLACIALAQTIGTKMATIATQQAAQATAEATFSTAMGDMLKDGSWQDKNYVAGQEDSLYADALIISAEMARPQYSYTLSILDLSSLDGYEDLAFHKNQKVRLWDSDLGINDIAYVQTIDIYPRQENRNVIKLSTDETGVALKSFATLISRIMKQADVVKENQGIYDRARALNGDGTIASAKLNGEINLLRNKMLSTASGIYTDENGNMIIEAADGQSAMMLTGAGFMVAAEKDGNGEYVWRTFGDGKGFTADVMTAGVLRAGLITILGSDQFYWDSENIYIFDPTASPAGSKYIAIGKYDGTNYGIGYTTDGGTTWQNAISFSGVTLNATDALRLSTVETGLSLVPGEISAAVGAIEVGGTNLLQLTRRGFSGWTAGSGVTIYDRVVSGLGNCRRYTVATSGTTISSFEVQCYTTYTKLVSGETYTLSTKVANYGKACTYLLWDSDDGTTWTNKRSAGSLQGYLNGFHDFIYTFTATESKYMRVGIAVINMTSDVDLFDTWKLEEGNKATAWAPCPTDPADAVESGSTVVINKDMVQISTPVFEINVSGSNGDTTFDQSGLTVPVINSPCIAPRYTGPAAVTVNANNPSDSSSTFRTLTDALAAISGKWLDINVTITVATNTSEPNSADSYAVLRGVFGPGSVTIAGGSKTVGTRMLISSVGVPVSISSLTFASTYVVSPRTYVVKVAGSPDITISGCTINGPGVANDVDGLECDSGFVKISSTNIGNCRFPIAARGGHIHVDTCTGSGYYGLTSVDGGKITYNGTYPSGTSSNTFTARGGEIGGSGSSSGGTTPTPPTSTTTVTASSVVTKTYQPSGSGWLTDNTLKQGTYGGYNHFGVMSFGTTGWSGKTIVAGSLSIRRLDGGKGSSIKVKLKTTSSTAASGQANPNTNSTDYGEIGTVNINNTLTCAIPAAALQEIANGTRKSLMLYADGSTDYGVFAGSDNATYKPSLTVTYNT